MTTKEKRKKIEDTVLQIIGLLDSDDHYNYNKYSMMFDSMDDAAFGKWCNHCNDPDNLDQLTDTVIIQTVPFKEPSLKNILKAMQIINVPTEEYVYFSMFSNTPVRSKYPIPVGYLNIKRMEQMLEKKNHYTYNNDKRSLLTDQVSAKESKVAAISQPEVESLLSVNANNILKEFYGARSGDEAARNSLLKQINLNGYATLDKIEAGSNIDTKTTLNSFNTYMIASGFRSDLVSYDLKLPYTIDKELHGANKQ